MSERKLLRRIRRDGRRIAKQFKLRYLEITKESPRVRSRYGSCDQDRVIRIRLNNLTNGDFLRYANLINTLCHELAHIRYMDHGKKFKNLNNEILLWAKGRGIYRPHFRRAA
jgi:predicted metal-dependent hydrolase